MVDSSLSFQTANSTLIRNSKIFPTSDAHYTFKFIFLIPFILISIAIFSVPERPDQLASICEKYHSSAACRVW